VIQPDEQGNQSTGLRESGGILAACHPTQTMKNLITNPLTRAAIAGVAVWLASVLMAHGQNKPDNLKQRILAQAQSVGAE
jgi:hypothetical protein